MGLLFSSWSIIISRQCNTKHKEECFLSAPSSKHAQREKETERISVCVPEEILSSRQVVTH